MPSSLVPAFLRRFRRDDRGSVVVEFALVLPLFVLVLFAVMEFARAYGALNAVTTAAREGGRLAAVMPDPSSDAAFDSVKSRVHFVSASMFGPDTIVVSRPTCDVAPPDCRVVTVTTTTTLTGVTPLLGMLGYPSGIPMSRTSVFRWERAEQIPAPAP